MVDVEAGGRESEGGVSCSALLRIIFSLGAASQCNLCLELSPLDYPALPLDTCHVFARFTTRNIVRTAAVRIAIARPTDG